MSMPLLSHAAYMMSTHPSVVDISHSVESADNMLSKFWYSVGLQSHPQHSHSCFDVGVVAAVRVDTIRPEVYVAEALKPNIDRQVPLSVGARGGTRPLSIDDDTPIFHVELWSSLALKYACCATESLSHGWG